MVKLLFLIIFIWVLFTNVYAQVADTKFALATEAYNNHNYGEAVALIAEIKLLYKSVPPKVLLLEIIADYRIILEQPLNYFDILYDTRKLVSNYLNENASLYSCRSFRPHGRRAAKCVEQS